MEILLVIFCFIVLLIPSVLTYNLYKFLKNKGEIQKTIGLAIFISTTILTIFYSIKFLLNGAGFGPEYERAEIAQKIGGKLICESVYTADHHSWQYHINYKYIDTKGHTLDFKDGSYYGREWNKDEQIKKYNDWLILKTGARYDSDRLIIKNIESDSTKVFDIDPEYIDRDSIWKAQNIKLLLNSCCAETFIESIKGNEVTVSYKFRTDEELTEKYDVRKIIYRIDEKTGDLKMTAIKASR